MQVAYSELLRNHQLFVLAADVMRLCDDELHQAQTDRGCALLQSAHAHAHAHV